MYQFWYLALLQSLLFIYTSLVFIERINPTKIYVNDYFIFSINPISVQQLQVQLHDVHREPKVKYLPCF